MSIRHPVSSRASAWLQHTGRRGCHRCRARLLFDLPLSVVERDGDTDGQGDKGTVQASVSASGNLSTVKTAEENLVSGGTLATLTATVGEKVKAGQVLASVDATSQRSQSNKPRRC